MAFDLAEQRVLETEAALGATLPSAYRAAMMANNGGVVEAAGEDWTLHPIRDNSDRKRLARSANNIASETRACMAWRGFPAGAVAIARNGAGDCVVFLRAGTGFDPAPRIWRHETGALVHVADDFGALPLSR